MKTGLCTTAALFGDDATSATGAQRIKERIERYWRERGFEVHVTLKRLPYIAVAREAAFAISSDLINGLPREAFAKQKQGEPA